MAESTPEDGPRLVVVGDRVGRTWNDWQDARAHLASMRLFEYATFVSSCIYPEWLSGEYVAAREDLATAERIERELFDAWRHTLDAVDSVQNAVQNAQQPARMSER